MNKLLVVVDCQKDFFTGSLRNQAAIDITGNICNKIRECASLGYDISVTYDTHHADAYLDSQEGKNLPVIHCVEYTDGWMLVPDVAEALDGIDYNMYKKSVFGSEELATDIISKRYDEILLVGVCTGICVISNAVLIKTYNPETKVIVDSSCVACVTEESNHVALEAMKTLQIEVI